MNSISFGLRAYDEYRNMRKMMQMVKRFVANASPVGRL